MHHSLSTNNNILCPSNLSNMCFNEFFVGKIIDFNVL